ncbi:uncharacterized protein [Amphiura filiformis]|uniref:uncharacterized protein n=1 Tax=Amphiura filiformis TaxID=82378 RepID=UPI003B20DC8E
MCTEPVKFGQRALDCDKCGAWTHSLCGEMDNDLYDEIVNTNFDWMCPICEATHFDSSFFSSSSDNSDPECSTQETGKKQSTKAKPKSSHLKTVKGFTILNINFQSIMNKRSEWESLLHDIKPDFIQGTETWLEASIDNAEFLPEEYTAFRKDRPNDRHGGVIFVYRKDIPVIRRLDLEGDSESIWCQLDIEGRRSLLFGTVYKPRHDDIDTVIDFKNTLEIINSYSKLKDIIIQGDFNQPNVNWDDWSVIKDHSASKETAELLMQVLQNNGLDQLVKRPTRLNSILDLAMTNNASIVGEVDVIPGLSDHEMVKTVWKIGLKRNRKPPRKIYLRHRAETDKIKQDLSKFQEEYSSSKNNNSVQKKWDNFESKIKEVMEAHIPSKMISSRWNLPWFQREHRRMCRKKRRLYIKAKLTGDQAHWDEYKEFKKVVRRTLNKSRRDYINGTLAETVKENPKAFWSFINKIRKEEAGVADLKVNNKIVTSDGDKAEVLSSQFASVYTRKRHHIFRHWGGVTYLTYHTWLSMKMVSSSNSRT